MQLLRSSISTVYRRVLSLQGEISKACGGMGHMNAHPYSPEPVSGSGIVSRFGTSSRAGILIPVHFAWSSGHPLAAVLPSTPGRPRSLASVVGNGPHHCSLCRYAYVAQPVLYTKGDRLKILVMDPLIMCHHRLPTRGTQDDEHHSHLAGPRHQAGWSS